MVEGGEAEASPPPFFTRNWKANIPPRLLPHGVAPVRKQSSLLRRAAQSLRRAAQNLRLRLGNGNRRVAAAGIG